jgi:proline utilization trans-activator
MTARPAPEHARPGSSSNIGRSTEAGPSSQRFVLGESLAVKMSQADGGDNRRRRVPDELRQRSEISCDRCKKRKRRCIRSPDDEKCAACEEAGAECQSTLPRKRRNLPSQLSLRYATLDAIIRKTYPDVDTDDMEQLQRIAEELGVDIPVRGSAGFRQIEEEPGRGVQDNRTVEPLEIPEGWLVPAPRGGHHYVGPSSLVYFAKCARQLVAKSNVQNNPTYDEAGLRRYLQAAAFTTYKVSHTIEANLQGHPATFAAGTEQSPSALPSVGDPATDRSRPSPGGDGFRQIRLPDRQTADALVAAFFDRVHLNFPILHRGAFHVLYEASHNREINLASEPGKACTLYMVLTLGAQALEGQITSAQTLQQQYLSIVIREGLGRLILTSTLANVQALLLLALYQHNAGERNTAYILTGQAIRAAVASGLHKDGDNARFEDPFERNIRRTVWWYLHIFEQTISLALGRPSFTDAIHVNTTLPDSSYEVSIGLPAGYLEAYVSLSQFIVRIKQVVGIVSIRYEDPSFLVNYHGMVMDLHTELIAWKKGLPQTLSMGQSFTSPVHRRLITLLQIWADYFESVLCRPYLLCRVNQDISQQRCSSSIDDIAGLCASAAHASMTKLLLLSDNGLLESSVWLDYYAAQHAIMILSLQFLGQPNLEDWDSSREPISQLIAVAQTTRLAPTYRITMNVALQLSCIAGIGPDIPIALDAPTAGTPEKTNYISTNTHTMDPTIQLFGPIPPTVHQASEPAVFGDLYNLGYDAASTNPWDFFNIENFAGDYLQSSQASFTEDASFNAESAFPRQ